MNTRSGTDIVSILKFGDHDLHVEFRVGAGGNSGVYVQSRYEVQVEDSFGKKPEEHICGAVYGKIKPSVNASKPAGEWQTFDIHFVQPRLGPDGKVARKARISVTQNGQKTIDNAEIDGLTGLTLEDQEGVPGGLMLQGDHTAIEYRNIRARPIKVQYKTRAGKWTE